MVERWSQADRNIYGAEDDEDMDAILVALERASDSEELPGTYSTDRRSKG